MKSLTFGFATPKRHVLARNCVFWRILRQNPCGRLGCRRDEEPKKNEQSRVNNLTREIPHAQKRNTLSDLDEILQDGRYPRHNHVGKFWWRSVKGFRVGGGANFGLSYWLWSSSLQHSRATVRVCEQGFCVFVRPREQEWLNRHGYRVTVAYWKGCLPEVVAGGPRNPTICNNLLQQTMSVFTKIGWFAPWVYLHSDRFLFYFFVYQ